MRRQSVDETLMIGHAGQERTIGTLSARAWVGRTGHTLRRVSSVRRPPSDHPPLIWKKSSNYYCASAVGNKLLVDSTLVRDNFTSRAARGRLGRQIGRARKGKFMRSRRNLKFMGSSD
jgi:hypothetical protein